MTDFLASDGKEGGEEYMKIAYKKTILVLNVSYEPVNHTSWKRARILVLKGKAYVISSRTIRLKNYIKIPQCKMVTSRPTRALILKRDGHTCQYCGYRGDKLTIDHVVPKSKGGGETWQNLVTSCLECNNCKDNRTPEQWANLLKRVFSKETLDVSSLPFTWSSFQIGMMESRINSKGTTLVSKPKIPFNKISVSISTSEVDEWRNYIYT